MTQATTCNHSVEITRNGKVSQWHVDTVDTPDYLPERTAYGVLVEHWPDGTHAYQTRKNHAIIRHTFTPKDLTQ